MPTPPSPTLRQELFWGPRTRAIVVAGALVFMQGCAYVFAFLLRFDGKVPDDHAASLVSSLPWVLLGKAAATLAFSLHRGSLRHAGMRDVEAAVFACASASAWILATNTLLLDLRTFPRSVYLLDFLLAVALIAGGRLALRMVGERTFGSSSGARRLLLVGGGDTGEALIRQIARRSKLGYVAVAIVDDDPRKHGLLIHGVPVVGPVASVADAAARSRAEEIVIATPSATGDQLRSIVSRCRETGLPCRVLPPTEEVLAGAVHWRQLRDVQIEDLLRRAPVQLDTTSMSQFLDDRVVMVTGAGGSIGSEICRQVASWKPRLLVMLDHAENPLFYLGRELEANAADVRTTSVVADVRDRAAIAAALEEFRPSVVIHAAAHKHVPLMERNVCEAVRTNVFGTRNVAELAGEKGVETFLLISTDKAVRPSSVMGTTKRIAELLMAALGAQFPRTRYVAVRFGNVLASAGSVVPIFQEQIARGGPVTVTHPEMKRYFMTIPEAARLVIQAAALGSDGTMFILDMGEPVRIVDLAEDVIRLSGLEPGIDIEIRFSGIRPGEKLYEELSLDAEGVTRTGHEKIFRGKLEAPNATGFAEDLDRLFVSVSKTDELDVRRMLASIVPEAQIRTWTATSGTVPVARGDAEVAEAAT